MLKKQKRELVAQIGLNQKLEELKLLLENSEEEIKKLRAHSDQYKGTQFAKL